MSDAAILGIGMLASKPGTSAQPCSSCLGQCMWSRKMDRSDQCLSSATRYDFLCDRHREYKNRVLRIGREMRALRTLYEGYRRTGHRNPAGKAARSRAAIGCAIQLGRFLHGPGNPKSVAAYIVATALAAEQCPERPLSAETTIQVGAGFGLELSVDTFVRWPAMLDAVNLAESPLWPTLQEKSDA